MSRGTSIFGLRLSVVLGMCLGTGIVLLIFLISLWLSSRLNNRIKSTVNNDRSVLGLSQKPTIPNVSEEMSQIRADNPGGQKGSAVLDPLPESDPVNGSDQRLIVRCQTEESPNGYQRIHIEIGKDHLMSYPERGTGSLNGSREGKSGEQMGITASEVSHLGWGHWYTLRELQVSTKGFADENVIGEGGNGIVYRGFLDDSTQVAVKCLFNNRGEAEQELKGEVEAIGRIRHKNLVRLLGCCVDGVHRMLVYEYVDNGNLEQWLHGDVGFCSPLTWEIRMKIMIGTAKGLTYLHEGLEPKVVHRDIKSSNILLDKQWNPKVSDFGLAKLLGPEWNYVTTRVMGTFGYVAPEYASTGMLSERSDVYSFGVLLMEMISGRNPVDYSRLPAEVKLIDWLKEMVSNRKTENVVDPKLHEKPSLRALKRVLLVALRCVDPNAQNRPTMGHIVHMLEAEELPVQDDRKAIRGRFAQRVSRQGLMDNRVIESGDSSGYESGFPTASLPRGTQEHAEKS